MLRLLKGSPVRQTSLLPQYVEMRLLVRMDGLDTLTQADVDDLGAAKATLAGLKKRHALGVAPIFINTVSGTLRST
jgi:hypothetical protein